MSSDVRAFIRVEGIVQGVGYRFFVQRTGRRMGLTGWVRNTPDGAVEMTVEGPHGIIESFRKELCTGNPWASVRDVNIRWERYCGEFNGFDIRV
ncbi:MAG TPA: acylphosphatase [bacterium]|nr:acylphosphatase [bacterium]